MIDSARTPLPGPAEFPLRWQVGEARITRIPEKYVELAFATFLPDGDPDAPELGWMPRAAVTADGDAVQSFHSFVIEIGDEVIVVDTGYGDRKMRPGRVNAHMLRTTYLDSFALAGYSRRDVTTVINSHGHLDHIGWNTVLEGDAWVPAFPQARYVMDHVELAYWTEGKRSPANDEDAQMRAIEDSLLPLRAHGVMTTTRGAQEINDGVEVVPFPGHTPGHLCVRVRSNGAEAWITGDLLIHPSHISFPEWGCSIDTDPAQAERSRRSLLAQVADRDVLVLGSHWVAPTGMRVQSSQAQRFQGMLVVAPH
ncbi:MBL fold metallo-hydrolase [Microbacterium sp. A94]|uniref:MBL fold metallo-hydrolase n=1 Tax=Microbacterium sp. A94 TaxID=3450717 RepID=UPI003F421FB7